MEKAMEELRLRAQIHKNRQWNPIIQAHQSYQHSGPLPQKHQHHIAASSQPHSTQQVLSEVQENEQQ
jgi:hypothetical protein